ncbi:MAG: hypothetical protein ACJ8AH_27315 [Stellaceae bacterium]
MESRRPSWRLATDGKQVTLDPSLWMPKENAAAIFGSGKTASIGFLKYADAHRCATRPARACLILRTGRAAPGVVDRKRDERSLPACLGIGY